MTVSSSVSLRSRLSVPECSVSLSLSSTTSNPAPGKCQVEFSAWVRGTCTGRARRNHQCQPSTVPEAAAVRTLTGWRDETREEGGKLPVTLCRAGSARKTAVRYLTHYFRFGLEMKRANPRFDAFILWNQRNHWRLISALRRLAIQDTNVCLFFMCIFIHVSSEQM